MSLGKAVWVSDYGEFDIPPDVMCWVTVGLRRDGWFDKRKNIAKRLRLYFAEQERLYQEAWESNKADEFVAQSWDEWNGA